MSDTDLIDDLRRAPDLYPALEAAMARTIGHRLFTLMVIDPAAAEAARVHSSDPAAYPVAGRKPLGDLTEWGDVVLRRGEPFIGYDAGDIARVFPDHETIARLGCASVLNVPVVDAGTVIGTMNLLHEAGHFDEADAIRAAPFAALLVGPYREWARG
ncbi:GAF domain-containing protein [Jannaschia sp. LMIT008]|uniref:GAF domain-containing protein n=1 Tax=Jannaschia maritima TaxID=3032585 RepID=UPI0028127042|nr:GAF domain-containing protein [Jannaschia sp. LMIT008]